MNITNLRFCHCSKLLTSNPNIPFLIPSTHIKKLTPKPYSISFKSNHFSPIRASMASSTVTEKPFSVLFVCLGNICRSPAAEGVFTDLVQKRGIHSNFRIDSAGTINYHEVGISINIFILKKYHFWGKKMFFFSFFCDGFFRLFEKLIFFFGMLMNFIEG